MHNYSLIDHTLIDWVIGSQERESIVDVGAVLLVVYVFSLQLDAQSSADRKFRRCNEVRFYRLRKWDDRNGIYRNFLGLKRG